MPRVSVIIPNYNHVRFLERRIESVLRQTFQDFELILLDDASTDESLSILRRYTDDPRVRLVVNGQNSGSAFPQWNKGVSLATAPYVWIAEADDDADPVLLERLVAKLDADPAVMLAYSQSWMVDPHDNKERTMEWWTEDLDPARWSHDFVADGKEESSRYLVFKNTIPNASAVVFRRGAYLAMGGAPEQLRLCGDWLAWAAIIRQGKVAFVAEPLNCFRQHGGTVRTGTARLAVIEEWLTVRRAIAAATPPSPAVEKEVREDSLREWKSAAHVRTGRPDKAWLQRTAADVSAITGRSLSLLALSYAGHRVRAFLGLGRLKRWLKGGARSRPEAASDVSSRDSAGTGNP